MRPGAGDYLFVYGTLQSTAGHALWGLLSEKAVLVGRGAIRARLYIVHEVDDQGDNWFPAAVPTFDKDAETHGEVYQLRDPEPLLTALDRYENCGPEWPEPNEFLLRRIDVAMAQGGALQAFTYLYTYDVSAARLVPSGRFDEVAPEVR
ncbi:MAG: gamma-glutamylcyclotransferase family protein [Pseudomonadota bacterium]